MKKVILLITFCALSCSALASDNLTVRALQSGHASGLATEEQTQKIMSETHSNSPVTMDVRVMHRYTQPGCARLDYIVRQPNVKAKDGSLQELKMQWQMNICEDGQPPAQPLTIKK